IGAPIEPLARRRRDLPRELTRALDLAVACDPERRGTLAELHEALAETLRRGRRRRLFAPAPVVPSASAHVPPRTSDEDGSGGRLSPNPLESAVLRFRQG